MIIMITNSGSVFLVKLALSIMDKPIHASIALVNVHLALPLSMEAHPQLASLAILAILCLIMNASQTVSLTNTVIVVAFAKIAPEAV